MSTYRISLVVAIYGVEKYIAKFAESALGQTSDDVQFVFVNDGTKDRSMDILNQLIENEYPHLIPRIVIVNKENGGLPSARKAGLDVAEGEYVLFADSDDWLEKNVIEKLVAKIDETDADIVYFDLVKEYGNKTSYTGERDYKAGQNDEYIINIFNYKSHGFTWNKCFRRSLYTDNVIYFPKLGMHEDIYLMSQLILHAKSFAHIPEALYHYRKDNPDSFCSQDRRKRHVSSTTNLLDLYEHYRANLHGSPIEKVAGSILMRAGQHSLMHGYDFFDKYPYLAGDLRKTRISCRYRTSLPMQIIVKLYALFR